VGADRDALGRPAPRGEDLIGHDVNVAARIVGVAAPGELLCSHATMLAAGANLEGIDFVELGPVVMKGIPEPIELFRAERVLRPSTVGWRSAFGAAPDRAGGQPWRFGPVAQPLRVG
jgi:class 3 adenylate cyclase